MPFTLMSIKAERESTMQDDIHKVLSINGIMGVNAIAKALHKPVATVQKYLNSQTYFIKTESRQWTLPNSTHALQQPNKLIEEARELLTLMNVTVKKMQTLLSALEAKPTMDSPKENKKEPKQTDADYPVVIQEIQDALDRDESLWLRPLWENIDVVKLHNNINALYRQSEKDGDDFGNIYMNVIHENTLDDSIDISRMFPIFTEILEKSQKDSEI